MTANGRSELPGVNVKFPGMPAFQTPMAVLADSLPFWKSIRFIVISISG
jgi:hypothetical protein